MDRYGWKLRRALDSDAKKGKSDSAIWMLKRNKTVS